MRKLLLTTAAVAAAIGSAVAGEPSFGTFTDTRDGQTYRTVVIGGKKWMAQNLNYRTTSGSWCYNDSVSYCDKYGRLYNWNAAIKACPAGYHLPSNREWDESLTKTADYHGVGKKLKSKSGWNDYKDKNGNGTDDFGFSALPGGCRVTNGRFDDVGNFGYWWLATVLPNDYANACYRYMRADGDYINEDFFSSKRLGGSVRCVADRP
jgi:uncharacterized protein (TIGR02145 family)